MIRTTLFLLSGMLCLACGHVLADSAPSVRPAGSAIDQGLQVRRIRLPASYLLKNNQFNPDADRYLDRLAKVLQQRPVKISRIVIVGHSDKQVELTDMDQRSMLVAKLVRARLLTSGIRSEQIGILGLGALRPNPKGEDWRVDMDITGHNLPSPKALRNPRPPRPTIVATKANPSRISPSTTRTNVALKNIALRSAPKNSAQQRLRRARLSRELLGAQPRAAVAPASGKGGVLTGAPGWDNLVPPKSDTAGDKPKPPTGKLSESTTKPDPGAQIAYQSVAPTDRYVQFLRDVGSRALMERSYKIRKLLAASKTGLSDDGQILLSRLSKEWKNDSRFRGAMVIGRYKTASSTVLNPAEIIRGELIQRGINPQHVFYMVVPATDGVESIDIAVVRKPLTN